MYLDMQASWVLDGAATAVPETAPWGARQCRKLPAGARGAAASPPPPQTGVPLLQATTPLDPRVIDAMLPFMTEQYGNPHSRTHLYGWEAEEAVEVARGQVGAGGVLWCAVAPPARMREG